MNLLIEWQRLRGLMRAHLEAGGTMVGLARQTGIGRSTLYSWIDGEEPPLTIVQAARLMEALKDAGISLNDRQQAGEDHT